MRHIEAERVMLVCDPGMVQFGYALVKRQLELNRHRPAVDVFSDVEPNPSTNTVYKGLERFVDFQPDVIIALGGGSAMDAAKAMWMFFEHPDVSFFGAKQKFLISVNVLTRFLTLRRHNSSVSQQLQGQVQK
ncbi:MAG: iron-containing alcohol dehydrogenase [Streptococcus sp.]